MRSRVKNTRAVTCRHVYARSLECEILRDDDVDEKGSGPGVPASPHDPMMARRWHKAITVETDRRICATPPALIRRHRASSRGGKVRKKKKRSCKSSSRILCKLRPPTHLRFLETGGPFEDKRQARRVKQLKFHGR